MRYDFALLFTALTALSGAIWLIDALFFAKARRKAVDEQQAALDLILDARAERIHTFAEANGFNGVGVERQADGLQVSTARPEDVEKLRKSIERELPDLRFEVKGRAL